MADVLIERAKMAGYLRKKMFAVCLFRCLRDSFVLAQLLSSRAAFPFMFTAQCGFIRFDLAVDLDEGIADSFV